MRRINPAELNFDKLNGLIPAVVQDRRTKAILMVGFMNSAALERTLATQKVTFWSRTRGKLWEKGETSGNGLKAVSMSADCDGDVVLIQAQPSGPTCHTGDYSCFDGDAADDASELSAGWLRDLYELIARRKAEAPAGSYTAGLFKAGLPRILSKVREEADEAIRAAESETRRRLTEEAADLIFHLLVALVEKGVALDEVVGELRARNRNSKRAS